MNSEKIPKVSIHDEKHIKEEPDKTRSYPGEVGQNTKKEMTHIKRKEEIEEGDT